MKQVSIAVVSVPVLVCPDMAERRPAVLRARP
jgi:hypothetical protein